jgi:deoxyadenosine/deoxycytidine kinase
MSSFYDEGNKMKEEIIEKENVSFTFCALEVMLDSLSQRELIKEKRNSTFERKQWVKRKTYFSNLNENFSKVKFTCNGFFRVIFDPGGFRTTNSRSNSLEEGGNDVILI